jgi:hypothetical protein
MPTDSVSATLVQGGTGTRPTSMVRSTIQSIFQTVERPQGGSIERWEDESFRKCFADILSGNWRAHDPYELEGRLDARTSLYGRPGQVGLIFVLLSDLIFIFRSRPCLGPSKVGWP